MAFFIGCLENSKLCFLIQSNDFIYLAAADEPRGLITYSRLSVLFQLCKWASILYGLFFWTYEGCSEDKLSRPALIAQWVECPLRGTGGHGFDPGPRHTKVVKMVLAAPRLALRVELGLVDPVSG